MRPRVMSRVGVGKVVVSVVAVVTGAGPFVFDWNATHIHNPAWPPHAKFHNAQTMSLGAGLAAATLVQLWRPARSAEQARTAVDGAAVTAGLYWVTQASALAYPGAKAVDPPGEAFFPQAVFALPCLALVALGWALERRRLH